MSTTDYRNQETLNKALNIYRTCMRGFIIFHLAQIPGTTAEDVVIESVSDQRADAIDSALNAGKDIKSIIDIDDFPLLVTRNWGNIFKQLLNDDKGFGNQLWLIKDCRDQNWAHPDEEDAKDEGTRAYLFLVAEVLRKIKRPDKQREVETIRDELFFDDSAERLEKAEKDNAEYKKSLAAAEQRFADVESEKRKYEKDNTDLLQKVDEKEKQRKKLDRNLKNAKKRNDKLKSDVAGVEKRLEKSEAVRADYKNRLETKSKELNGTHAEWKETEERLATALNQLAAAQGAEKGIAARLRAVQNLFTVAAIGEREVQEVFQSVYPPIETDSTVRILDRRGVNKKNYLLELLEQKQPTIIYVQSEVMVDLLLERIIPEKADLLEKHGQQTSEAEEAEILEKLAMGELIAVVSSRTVSILSEAHCVEHFVFCHLVPSLDVFFERCQTAFTSARNVYLHLIYNNKEDIERLNQWLFQKYPEREMLEKLYTESKKLAEANSNFIESEKVYNELNMAKLGIETGLTIFEELRLIDRNEDCIQFLPPSGRKLDESKIYDRGEKLKQEVTEIHAFQLEQPIEKIWEKITLNKADGSARLGNLAYLL